MAYCTSPDAFDEYLQIAERTSRECLDHFTKCIRVLYYDRNEKTLKFKRVQEAARKDIERAFGVLQSRWDEGFEVNFRDMFVNPAPNIVRDWVERCDLHVRKTKELRDRKTHNDLRKDLVEHLWNNDDE
ncbi:ALP1-like protein isoform X1 [Tanacetum coccineum]